jgi:serine/threonine protein phosphatase PrpC
VDVHNPFIGVSTLASGVAVIRNARIGVRWRRLLIITAMGSLPEEHGARDPFLGMHAVNVYVRDQFAIYTDGITEALNQRDEEFGEERLLDVMRRARDLSPGRIVTAVFEEVRRFSGDQQHDDVTLIVARCRSREAGRPQPGA